MHAGESDADLIGRIVLRDERSMRVFYERHKAMVGRLVAVSLVITAAMPHAASADPSFNEAPAPGAGKALVYVYRVDAWPVVSADAIFSINGTKIGTLRAKQYTWFYITPGSFRLQQKWDIPQVLTVTSREFTAGSGSTHYFRLAVEGGIRQMAWRFHDVTFRPPLEEISKLEFHSPVLGLYRQPDNPAAATEQSGPLSQLIDGVPEPAAPTQ